MLVTTQWPLKRTAHLTCLGLCGMEAWKLNGAICAMDFFGNVLSLFSFYSSSYQTVIMVLAHTRFYRIWFWSRYRTNVSLSLLRLTWLFNKSYLIQLKSATSVSHQPTTGLLAGPRTAKLHVGIPICPTDRRVSVKLDIYNRCFFMSLQR